MSYSSSDIQQLKERTDIVDIVSSFVELRRSGSTYQCRCPWHDERRPSLSIDARRQLFRCWVCDIGGDVIAFLQRMGMSFRDSIEYLADRAGVTITPLKSSEPPRPSKLPLYDAMARVAEFYRAFYVGSPAQEYARSRGITDDVAEQFRLGYAPDTFRALLGLKTVTEETLFQLGMLGRSERGTIYDLYKHRLMIPIVDSSGRVVSMAGRVLPGAVDNRKYINGASTSIFDKSSTLYGYHSARHSIRQAGKAIVVEGYADTIALASAGIGNVCGVMGTSLTQQHLRLLAPIADQVVLLLDGDHAGVKRANELLTLFVAADVDVRVCTLPNGQDPDEFVRSNGVDALRSLIDQAPDAVDHRMAHAFDGVDATREPAKAATAIDEVVPLLRSMSDGVRRDLVVATMARWCHISPESISALIRRQSPRQPGSVAPIPSPASRLAEREKTLFAAMMASEAALSICIERIDPRYLSEAGRELYALFARVEALGEGTAFESLMTMSAGAVDVQSMVVSLAQREIDLVRAETMARETLDRINADGFKRDMKSMPLEKALEAKQK